MFYSFFILSPAVQLAQGGCCSLQVTLGQPVRDDELAMANWLFFWVHASFHAPLLKSDL